MKINLEVVGGFIGAGKSAFINSLIRTTSIEGERIIVLSMEEGNTKISDSFPNTEFVKSYQLYGENEMAIELLLGQIINENPHRVIIELNGADTVESFYSLVYHKEVESKYNFRVLYYVINGETCEKYLKNFGELLIPTIRISNLIIFNNAKAKKNKKCIELVKKINMTAHIIEINDFNKSDDALIESNLFETKRFRKLKMRIKEYYLKMKGGWGNGDI